jgi:hypothetical protein
MSLKKKFSSKNKPIRGDSGSVAEEILADIPEITQKCRAIDLAISGQYFTRKEALKIYAVTDAQYKDYLKEKKKQEKHSKDLQAREKNAKNSRSKPQP